VSDNRTEQLEALRDEAQGICDGSNLNTYPVTHEAAGMLAHACDRAMAKLREGEAVKAPAPTPPGLPPRPEMPILAVGPYGMGDVAPAAGVRKLHAEALTLHDQLREALEERDALKAELDGMRKQGPVAELVAMDVGGKITTLRFLGEPLPIGTKLYASPVPAKEPDARRWRLHRDKNGVRLYFEQGQFDWHWENSHEGAYLLPLLAGRDSVDLDVRVVEPKS
jgi:hypothetical protein